MLRPQYLRLRLRMGAGTKQALRGAVFQGLLINSRAVVDLTSLLCSLYSICVVNSSCHICTQLLDYAIQAANLTKNAHSAYCGSDRMCP